MRSLHLPFLAVLALTAAACGGDSEPALSLDAEACEHLEAGPSTAITASADPASAEAITPSHIRRDITLPPADAGYAGWIALTTAAVGDHVFFFDRPVTLEIRDASDALVAIELSEPGSPECALVQGRHVVPLAAVGTYAVRIASPDQTLVRLVVELAAH